MPVLRPTSRYNRRTRTTAPPAPPPPLHERTPARIGPYRIEGVLAAGGMGRVYRGRDPELDRRAAIKVLPTREALDPARAARFRREIEILAGLSHPNTIRLYGSGWTETGQPYYAMEYLGGVDVQRLVERFGPLPASRAAFILRQVCGSLEEAHSRGIVHRDIKPSNVYLGCLAGRCDWVKVLDFGVAKRLESSATAVTLPGTIVGTLRYLAPEAVSDPASVDARSDVYGLGGLAYWMLTGRPPFQSPTALRLVIDHASTEPVRPSRASELAVPKRLDEIVMRCLEKDPADRFRDAGALLAELEGAGLADGWSHERAQRWWRLHGLGPSAGSADAGRGRGR